MRLRGISFIEAGNAFLEEYIAEHNGSFALEPIKSEDGHKAVTKKELDEALCYKTLRKLTKNLELSYESRIFQIQTKETGYRLVGAHVTVKENLAGEISIEYEGKILEYTELLVKDQQGRIRNKKEILLAGLTSPEVA